MSAFLPSVSRRFAPALVAGALALLGAAAWAVAAHTRSAASGEACDPTAITTAAKTERDCCRTSTSRAQLFQRPPTAAPSTTTSAKAP